METHENYVRQHQDIRTENGIEYGDVIEGVDFDYAAKMTALNAAVLARLAWAPPAPAGVRIGGAVRPATTLQWEAVDDPPAVGLQGLLAGHNGPAMAELSLGGRHDGAHP